MSRRFLGPIDPQRMSPAKQVPQKLNPDPRLIRPTGLIRDLCQSLAKQHHSAMRRRVLRVWLHIRKPGKADVHNNLLILSNNLSRRQTRRYRDS